MQNKDTEKKEQKYSKNTRDKSQSYSGKRKSQKGKSESRNNASSTMPGLYALAVPRDYASTVGLNLDLIDVSDVAETEYVRSCFALEIDEALFGYDHNTNTFSGLDAHIDKVLRAFSVARGYVTNVTPDLIKRYLVISTRILSLFAALYRHQQTRALRGRRNVDISALFNHTISSAPKNYYGWWYGDVDNHDYVVTSTLSTINISNADWAQQYLPLLNDVKLNSQMVYTIMKFFATHFMTETSLPDRSWITVYPNFIVQNHPKITVGGIDILPAQTIPSMTNFDTFMNGPLTSLQSYATLLTTINTAFPDLNEIMNLLGFTHDPITNLDFTRDLHGKTLQLENDPIIHDMIRNIAIGRCTVGGNFISALSDVGLFYVGADGIVLSMTEQPSINLGFSKLLYYYFTRKRDGSDERLLSYLGTIKRLEGNIDTFYLPCTPIRLYQYGTADPALSKKLVAASGIYNDDIHLRPVITHVIQTANYQDANDVPVAIPIAIEDNGMYIKAPLDDVVTLTFFQHCSFMFGSNWRQDFETIVNSLKVNSMFGKSLK